MKNAMYEITFGHRRGTCWNNMPSENYEKISIIARTVEEAIRKVKKFKKREMYISEVSLLGRETDE